jgi:quercetin 2,3-dioxygenase
MGRQALSQGRPPRLLRGAGERLRYRPDALPIRAEARVLGATLKAGATAEYTLGKGRHGYLVPAEGEVEVNGVSLKPRDGAAIEDESVVKITALKDSEIILVDAA